MDRPDFGNTRVPNFQPPFVGGVAVPRRVMADATGLSRGSCSLVRRGRKVPHRRRWAALARLGTKQES